MNKDILNKFKIKEENDIAMVRIAIRDTVKELGFSMTDITRIVTAASELARNIYHYAGRGTIQWRSIHKENINGIELIFSDKGPGIEDIEQALEPGYSTSNGMGQGLPGVSRLMDEMNIDSKLGKGTTVTVKKWLKD